MVQLNIKQAVKLATKHNRARQYNDAIELLEPLIPNNINNRCFLDVLGRAYLGNKQVDKTIDLLAEYNENHPENEYIAQVLSKAYIEKEEYVLAEGVLEDFLKYKCNSSWAKAKLVSVADNIKTQRIQDNFDPHTYSL